MNEMEKQDPERGPQPANGIPVAPDGLHALQIAMDRHLWCWDCGATDAKCAGYNRSGVKLKCCPDCRHRSWAQTVGVA